MKFLILLKKNPGGVGIYVKEVSDVLRKRGHTVEVISREDDLNIYSMRKSIRPLRKLVNSKDFDILFTQDWSLAIPFLFKRNHICTFHGVQPGGGKYWQTLVGNVIGRSLIVVGDRLKKRFPKATLAYNGVNLETFKPLRRKKNKKPVIGFSNWPIESYHYPQIRQAAKKLDYQFLSVENISHSKMNKFYNKIDIFVSLPPSYTGFNLVWLEAMASGVKRVIGNNAGIGSKLPITKVEDYFSLTEAIKNAESIDYRNWLTENRFTWENHVDKILNSIYCGVLRRKLFKSKDFFV